MAPPKTAVARVPSCARCCASFMVFSRARLEIGVALRPSIAVGWYIFGKKPGDQIGLPPRGMWPCKTTKPGKFWFCVPSPYVTHEPTAGRPCRNMPEFISNMAGVWLFDCE